MTNSSIDTKSSDIFGSRICCPALMEYNEDIRMTLEDMREYKEQMSLDVFFYLYASDMRNNRVSVSKMDCFSDLQYIFGISGITPEQKKDNAQLCKIFNDAL